MRYLHYEAKQVKENIFMWLMLLRNLNTNILENTYQEAQMRWEQESSRTVASQSREGKVWALVRAVRVPNELN